MFCIEMPCHRLFTFVNILKRDCFDRKLRHVYCVGLHFRHLIENKLVQSPTADFIALNLA